ncbi:hypothetical protein LSAT2_002433 [Lamellibrachia satsuma]|nr:hypothetical protein LSAT2_002433 [Lamellibrachia satsuma]
MATNAILNCGLTPKLCCLWASVSGYLVGESDGRATTPLGRHVLVIRCVPLALKTYNGSSVSRPEGSRSEATDQPPPPPPPLPSTSSVYRQRQSTRGGRLRVDATRTRVNMTADVGRR